MDQTANLSLAYIMPQQAQKYVTHNEALRDLDSLVQLAVLDRDLAAPPAAPGAGDRYLVAASPTGAWVGRAGKLAAFQDGGWLFYTPQKGWLVWVEDEKLLIAWTGSAWVVAGGLPVNPAPMLGVLATADTTNRLAVKSNAVLFANDDVTPGTGDMRIAVTKSAAGKTASLLFQDSYSGRAEFGLTGDDRMHLKVSPDGTNWKEALVADGATAQVGIGTGAPARQLHVAADDATNALPTEMLRLTHTTSGTPAAGIGVGVEFEVETATGGNTEVGMRLEAIATTVTGAAENFDFVLGLMAGGSAASEAFRVKAGGQMALRAGAFAANGAVPTSLTSVGPTGAHTSVQKWLAIDDAGTTRYIPCF
jgi:hypothetical protein